MTEARNKTIWNEEAIKQQIDGINAHLEQVIPSVWLESLLVGCSPSDVMFITARGYLTQERYRYKYKIRLASDGGRVINMQIAGVLCKTAVYVTRGYEYWGLISIFMNIPRNNSYIDMSSIKVYVGYGDIEARAVLRSMYL